MTSLGNQRVRSPEVPVPGRRVVLWLVVLLAAGVALPLVSTLITGAADIPRNDDWSYRRLALELATTGRFVLDGAAETMIVGQLVVTQPFLWLSGGQPWGFTVAGVTFAAALVMTAYALARTLLSPGLAAIAVGSLLVFPGFLAYATSYMSDVPGMAAQFACLTLGILAVRRRPVDLRWLTAAAITGCFAFSIRDFGIAAPASVIVAAILAYPRRRAPWVMGAAVLTFCVALYLWRSGLSGQLGDVVVREASASRIPLAFATLAFVLSPVVLIGALSRPVRWSRLGAAIGLVLGAALGLVRLAFAVMTGELPVVLLPNLLGQYGVPDRFYLLGGRPMVVSDLIWAAIQVLAVGTTILGFRLVGGLLGQVVGDAIRQPRRVASEAGSPLGVLALYVAFICAGLTLFGVRWLIFDRYFWPVIPPLACLLLVASARRGIDEVEVKDGGGRPNVRAAGALGLGAVVASLAIALMLNSSAFDAARWKAGVDLERLGVAPDEIDAGYEWMGYHATSLATAARPTSAEVWYRGWWPDFRECAVASSTPRGSPDLTSVGTVEYDLFAVAGPREAIYLYRSTMPACTR